MTTTHRVARWALLVIASATAGVTLAAIFGWRHQPTAADPGLPPMGWTEVCTSAAIGDVCRTYPPGDDSWDETARPPYRGPLPVTVGADNPKK